MTDVQSRRAGHRDPSNGPLHAGRRQRHAHAPIQVHPPRHDGDESNVIDVDGDGNLAAHGAASSRPSSDTEPKTQVMIPIPFRPDTGTYTRQWLLDRMQSAEMSACSSKNRSEAIPHSIEKDLALTIRNSRGLFLGDSTKAEEKMAEVLAQPSGSCSFLTVLPHDPPTVVVAHSLGRYATVGSLGDSRDRHRNRIVALVGEREGAVPWSSSSSPSVEDAMMMNGHHRLGASAGGLGSSSLSPSRPVSRGLSLPSLFLAPRGTSEEGGSVAEHLFGSETYRVNAGESEDGDGGDDTGERIEDEMDGEDWLRTPPPPPDELYGDVEGYHSPAPSCENDASDDVEEIKTARLMHIPTHWAVHFLGGMGPRRALRVARALIQRDLPTKALAKEASPLLDWLRVACQRENAGSDRSAVSVDWAPVLSTNRKVRGWAEGERLDPFLRRSGLAGGRERDQRPMGSSVFGGGPPHPPMMGRTMLPPPPQPTMPLPPPPMVPWTFPPSAADDDDRDHPRHRPSPPPPASEEASASASATAPASAMGSAMVSPSPIHSSSVPPPPAPDVALSGAQEWSGGGAAGGGATVTVKEEFRGEAEAEAKASAKTNLDGAEVPDGGDDGEGSDMDVGSDEDGGGGGAAAGAVSDPSPTHTGAAIPAGATATKEDGKGRGEGGGTAAASKKKENDGGAQASGGGGLGGRWHPNSGKGEGQGGVSAADGGSSDHGVSALSSSTATTDRPTAKAKVDGDDHNHRDGTGRSKESSRGQKRSHDDRGEKVGHRGSRVDHRGDDGSSHRQRRSSRTGDDERGGGENKDFSYASLGDRYPPNHPRRSSERDRGHHGGGGGDDGRGRHRDGHDRGHESSSGWEWSRNGQHRNQHHGYGWDESHGGWRSRQHPHHQQYHDDGGGGGWTQQQWSEAGRSDGDGRHRPPPSSSSRPHPPPHPPPLSSKRPPNTRGRGGDEGGDGHRDDDGFFNGSLSLREMGPFPDRLIGCLIGKGGGIVKSIARESRCKVRIDTDSMMVRVRGHCQREVDRALRMVRDRCEENNDCS